MATSVGLPLPGEQASRLQGLSLSVVRSRWVALVPLAAVMGLALVLNAWGLDRSGYGNTYYAAAVRSMTMSWKNFFFGSLDPGGFITVDKPPVFLWVDALTARVFGYSSWSLLAPSAVAGGASVGLLWLIVRRYFGVAAATIAGIVLALTPISVAVNRLNLPEPFYVLALVGAVGAVMLSLERRRWWPWTAIAGALVGVAFNTKMLAAWIPGPALALAIVVGVEGPWRSVWRRWLPRLAVLAMATFAVSASWMLIVDAWPASDRPYVGGSQDNSVMDLAIGYNGLRRIEGQARPGGRAPVQAAGRNLPPAGFPPQVAPNAGPSARGRTPGAGQPGAANQGAGFNGPGGIIAGSPGLLRMFDPANGGQIAWFLPFALLGSAAALWRWRSDRPRLAAVVVWLGWTLLFAGVFSYTRGIYHSYYTAAIAPGVAALAGIAAVALSGLIRRHAAWLAAAAAIAAVTVWVQLDVAGRFPDFFAWVRPIEVAAVLGGLAVLAVLALRRLPALPGLALVLAGLLLLPAAWSTHETAHASLNTTLPQAGPRGGAAGRTFGSDAFDSSLTRLGEWLNAHTDPNARWDLAVNSAQNASRLIAQEGLSVMAIGGFSGGDPTISVEQFASLVQAGDVRYVLVSGGGPGGPNTPQAGNVPGRNPVRGASPAQTRVNASAVGASAVLSAAQALCLPVTDPGLPAQYRNGLYDCIGMPGALGVR